MVPLVVPLVGQLVVQWVAPWVVHAQYWEDLCLVDPC